MNLLTRLFSEDGFMPHGHCYLWNPGLLGLHITADTLIALSYFSIPFTLLYFVRKRRDLEFHWMFVCFAVFIVACGLTHVMEIWNIWHPTYWLAGGMKALTAAASVPTAILLVRLMPAALAVPSPAALRQLNLALENELAERALTEAKIRQLNLELQRRTAALEAANRELEAFSYSVSHDLRAPLRHIDGFSNLLAAHVGDGLDQKGRGFLGSISSAALRMGRLIDGLLLFSRNGRAAIRYRTVNLGDLAREVRERLAADIGGRKVVWEIGPLPEVSGDETLLRQVFENLLDNAVKYTRPRPEARIEIGTVPGEPEFVTVFVRDNGAGFEMKYADKLFGVFQRLHREAEFEGTGVGLANVKRIIARHGGRVWATAEVNVGATFYFTLPLATAVDLPVVSTPEISRRATEAT